MLSAVPALALGQITDNPTKLEQQIRELDAASAKAILEKDDAGVDRLFAKDAVVNNPRGGLTYGASGVKELFRNGLINYASFERVVESVQIRGSTVIVMGNEAFAMKEKNGKAGPTIRRRFTNVWIKRSGKWQLTARHASIICQ
jgi:uncharacterized protein (TIGR02246 family)